jgi:hypothetical protein
MGFATFVHIPASTRIPPQTREAPRANPSPHFWGEACQPAIPPGAMSLYQSGGNPERRSATWLSQGLAPEPLIIEEQVFNDPPERFVLEHRGYRHCCDGRDCTDRVSAQLSNAPQSPGALGQAMRGNPQSMGIGDMFEKQMQQNHYVNPRQNRSQPTVAKPNTAIQSQSRNLKN